MRTSLSLLAAFLYSATAIHGYDYDVVIYGSTPSGVVAAAAASSRGQSAAIVEPSGYIGGEMAGGMVDDSVEGTVKAYGGVASQVYSIAASLYGGPNGTACHAAEPHVIAAAFKQMIDTNKITLMLNTEICSADVAGRGTASAKIASISPCDSSQKSVSGKVFIDATYEGDLIALAGVPHALGREARSDWNESLGGAHPLTHSSAMACSFNFGDTRIDPFNESNGDPLYMVCAGQRGQCAYNGGSSGTADGKVQAFNLRACLTQSKADGVPVEAPADYDPSKYELVRRYLKESQHSAHDASSMDRSSSRLRGAAAAAGLQFESTSSSSSSGYSGQATGSVGFADPWGCHGYTGGKCDTNDRGPVTISGPVGWQFAWAERNYTGRLDLLRENIDFVAGFFTFVSEAEESGPELRALASSILLCKDEFQSSPVGRPHWPFMPYVREARRLQGPDVFTQTDYANAVGAPESMLPRGRSGLGSRWNVSIGLGFWFLDSHDVQTVPANGSSSSASAGGRDASSWYTLNEGCIQYGRDIMDTGIAYGLPYGIMLPPAPEEGGLWTSGGRAHDAGRWSKHSYRGVAERNRCAGDDDERGESDTCNHDQMLLARAFGENGGAVQETAGVGNLLVSVAVSSTHVGFNPLRVEPTYMVLGEAAGSAAALAASKGVRVHDVDLGELQAHLREAGAVVTRDDMKKRVPPTEHC